MSKAEWRSHVDRSEALRTVLNHAVELSTDQAAFVRELIDVGELGLAFTFLCEYLDDLDAPISAADREIINALAPGLDSEKYARYLDDKPLKGSIALGFSEIEESDGIADSKAP